VRADLPATRELVDQLWQLARSAQDSALLSVAHRAMGTTFHFQGEFVLAQEHEAQGIALYDPQEHASLALLYGEHPAVVCQCFAAHDLWYLGYPDRALVSIQDALTLAQQLAHPFMLVHTLDFAAWLHLYRREGQLTREQAEADIALATEHKIAFFLAHGTIFRGWALVEQGRRTEGIAQIRQGLAAYRATGAECERPYLLALLAEAYGKVGQPEEGLLVVEEALADVRKGWRCCEAELYRLKGELLLGVSADNHAEAEACFHQALDITRRQQSKSLELRAAMSLSRLWQRQGKRAAAHGLLAPIYGWFSEGFETADLREAKIVLEALA
jgi:predicted ATPase